MAYTNSKTWISPQMAEQERWGIVSSNLRRMRFDRSPFVPRQFSEWIRHRAQYTAIQTEQEKRRLAHVAATRASGLEAGKYAIIPAFGGSILSDGRSTVLGQLTVWSVWTESSGPRRPAPWPGKDELKEEGDERHTSDFTRFLPIPRVPGNETVVWKQKALVRAYYLDYVLPIGTMKWKDDPRVKEAMEGGIEAPSDENDEGAKGTDKNPKQDTHSLTPSNPTDEKEEDDNASSMRCHVPLDVIDEEEEEVTRDSIRGGSVTITHDWNRNAVDEDLLEQYRVRLAEFEHTRIATTRQARSYPENSTGSENDPASRGSRRGIGAVGDRPYFEKGDQGDALGQPLSSTIQVIPNEIMPRHDSVPLAVIQDKAENITEITQAPSESTLASEALYQLRTNEHYPEAGMAPRATSGSFSADREIGLDENDICERLGDK